LKIAFDEHVAPKLAEAISALGGDTGMLRVEIVSARSYAIPHAGSDVPWLEKFAKDGGKVIISGDAKMRSKLHEQKALIDAGFVVIFFARRWNNANTYTKTAMLIKWWPVILSVLESSAPGQCFEIPFSWRGASLKEITPPGAKRRKPGAKQKQKRADEEKETNTAA